MFETSSESSRDLLWTVLGEFVLPAGGAAWTQTLIEAMDALGIREKAARQSLARLSDRGWLKRERIGRRTRWSLTPAATRTLTDGAARIYGFGTDKPGWDRQWLMLLASVPERDRQLRYRLGVGLRWAGFGSLGPGSWVSPWIDREPGLVELVDELGIEATTFVGSLGSLGEPTTIASQAWDLDEVRHEYAAFLSGTQALGAPSDDLDGFAGLVSLVHQWRRFPLLDPDLPLELLPADWPGAEAAQRFGALRTELAPAATAWWHAAEDRYAVKI